MLCAVDSPARPASARGRFRCGRTQNLRRCSVSWAGSRREQRQRLLSTKMALLGHGVKQQRRLGGPMAALAAATCYSLAPTAPLSSFQCGKSYSATPTSSSRASLGRMKISPVGRHVKDGGGSMAGAGARAQGQWPQHRTEDVFCLSRRRGRTDEPFFYLPMAVMGNFSQFQWQF